MSYFDDVRSFHRRFDLPHHPHTEPGILAEDVFEFRLKFLKEELLEFEEAHREGHVVNAADAIADLVYVALGTAHLMGLPFDAIWSEVQRANMAKVRATGADDARSKRGHGLDVVKPEGWRPPDHNPAVRAALSDWLHFNGGDE